MDGRLSSQLSIVPKMAAEHSQACKWIPQVSWVVMALSQQPTWKQHIYFCQKQGAALKAFTNSCNWLMNGGESIQDFEQLITVDFLCS